MALPYHDWHMIDKRIEKFPVFYRELESMEKW